METQAPLKEIQFPNKDQKNIWFGDIWSIVGQPITVRLTIGERARKVWQISIGVAHRYYKFYSTDRAEIDKLMRTIESAISPWYNKYEKFSDRKRKPRLRNLISKSTTALEKTTRQSSEKAQAPVKTEKVLVKEIQEHLMELKYYKSSIDGLYGPKTASAIKSYQRDNNLTPDGKPSSELLAHLDSKKETSNKREQTAESNKAKEPQTLEATVNKAVDGFFKAIFKKE